MADQTARQRVGHAASAAGWTAQEFSHSATEFRRRKDRLYVRWAVNGSIAAASTPFGRFDGTGKLARVLEYLEP
jgi:hypothetical protein